VERNVSYTGPNLITGRVCVFASERALVSRFLDCLRTFSSPWGSVRMVEEGFRRVGRAEERKRYVREEEA